MTIDSTEGHSGRRGGAQSMNVVNEFGLYTLVISSRKPEAKKFKRWITHDVIPSIRKTGSYSINEGDNATKELSVVKFVADDLRVSDASRLDMYKRYCNDKGIPTSFLPNYELNGSRQLCSATDLLKKYEIGLSAVKFNQLLINTGYLEERKRPSTKNPEKEKKFKALTEKGLKYGENAISPHNQKEVQPLYYEDSFMELYKEVTS